jgi:hypothetical protein
MVTHQFDDAPKLIAELKNDHFDVKAAFWLFRNESDEWYLQIVSDDVDTKGLREAYLELSKARRKLVDLSIGPLDVKLMSPSEPLARAVLDFLAKTSARIPTRVRGANLEGVYIEDAYIYPK